MLALSLLLQDPGMYMVLNKKTAFITILVDRILLAIPFCFDETTSSYIDSSSPTVAFL